MGFAPPAGTRHHIQFCLQLRNSLELHVKGIAQKRHLERLLIETRADQEELGEDLPGFRNHDAG